MQLVSTNLNFTYFRVLSHKFQLFRPIRFFETIFEKNQQIFNNFDTVALHLNKLELSLHSKSLYQVWLYLVQWRRRWKCEKFTTSTTTTTIENEQILNTEAHLILWLRWAKNYLFNVINDGKASVYILTKVQWCAKLEEPVQFYFGKPVTVWRSNIFEREGISSFVPVQKIRGSAQ